MRKVLVATLCSAFVIPGLGQIVNQQIKKGIVILVAVFVLFLVGILRLADTVGRLTEGAGANGPAAEEVLDVLWSRISPDLRLLAGAFVCLWLYAVLDALFNARNRRPGPGGSPL